MKSNAGGGDMDCSVVISTWNNSKRLALTLEAFCRCVLPPTVRWELVLVNNGCLEETRRVAEQFRSRLPLVYVNEPVVGVSRARNTGLAAASGRLLVFTDDDVTPCPQWLSAYWSAYQDRPVGYFFGGPIESKFEGGCPDPSLFHLAPCSVKGLDYGTTAKPLGSQHPFIAPNWACPAAILREVGGFDVRRGLNAVPGRVRVGSETHLMRQLRKQGWCGWYVPAARLTHFVPSNKSTPHHIAVRCEAGTFDRAEAFPWSQHPGRGLRLFVAAGLRMIEWWVVWRWRERSGKDACAYLKWREAVGWVAGFVEGLKRNAQRQVKRVAGTRRRR